MFPTDLDSHRAKRMPYKN